MLKSIILLLLFILLAQFLIAQETNLSQFFNFSTSINPAFSGATNYSRVNVGFRNQWLALNNGYNCSYVGVDHFIKSKNSGVGGFIKYDQAPSGYTNIQAQLQFAHAVQLTMKSAFRAGAQVGMVNNQFKTTDMVFGDQLSNDGAQSTATLENNVGWGGSKMYADLGIGLLYYSEKHWLGISGYHLNMPNVGFGSTASRLPISISAHAGIRMYVGRERGIQREVRNTFSPAVLLRNSANLFQFDFTGIYDFHPLLVGFGYRGIPILKYNKMQNDAIIFMAGYRTAQLIIAYSYDLTISSLGISTLGAHEIGIVFEFGDRAGGSKKANRVLHTPFPLLYSN
jgi:type IX secretion system PorP/SprF family membrane protein